jgi:hypothetical protein
MRRAFLVLTVLAACLTRPSSFAAQAAVVSGGAAVAEAWSSAAPIESAQYYSLDGDDYCWYDDGWNGPGWYWCGYDGDAGYGWGGPFGWNGWGGGYFWWRHRHDHDHDHGHGHGHGVFHDERLRESEVRPPPHGHAPPEGAYNHGDQFRHQRPGAGSNPVQNGYSGGNRDNLDSRGPDASSGPIGGQPPGNYGGPGPAGGHGGLRAGAAGAGPYGGGVQSFHGGAGGVRSGGIGGGLGGGGGIGGGGGGGGFGGGPLGGGRGGGHR